MSTALWCDTGNHAFSEKDDDRQHFTQTKTVKVRTGDSYGKDTFQDRQVVTTEVDICGPCYTNNSPFSTAKEEAIARPATVVDREMKQTEDYLRGYHEGILRGEVEE